MVKKYETNFVRRREFVFLFFLKRVKSGGAMLENNE